MSAKRISNPKRDAIKPPDLARGFDVHGSVLSPSTITENQLPKGWRWVRVNEIGEVKLGRQRAPKHQNGANMRPYLRVANVFEDRLDLADVLTMNFTPSEFETFALRENDILLNEGQSLHLVGRAALYRGEVPGACFQNTLVRFRAGPSVEPKFALTIFRGYMHTGKFQKIARWTTNIAHLGAQRFAEMPFPLPPLSDQRRIVAEIEKQFTRLDAGVAALRRTQANLKRYRAAVLKAACEGRLVPTEAELQKAEGRGQKSQKNFDTGEQLLTRILTERRKHWHGRGPYKEPAAPVIAHLQPFPAGWAVASLEQLTSPDRPICYGILMPKENVATGVLFVKVKDMKGDTINLEGLHRTTSEIAAKYTRASLRTGDLLLSIRGTYGRVAEVPKELDGGNITQDTARLDVTVLVNHRYVATCLRNPDCQNHFKRVARGVAVKGVNIGDVRPTPVPLPPLLEQMRIVAEVERRLSVVQELETVVNANLQRAARLRQSVLQSTFSANS